MGNGTQNKRTPYGRIHNLGRVRVVVSNMTTSLAKEIAERR